MSCDKSRKREKECTRRDSGIVGGAAAGATAGFVVAGPVGMAVGALAGAFAGDKIARETCPNKKR